MASRAYRARTQPQRTQATRERIRRAVAELLAEGTFHESTVEAVADRAGVSRATLYQHFGSRLGLVDAICETFGANPALPALKRSAALEDPERALAETFAHGVEFCASEEDVLRQLYGAAAIDQAAGALVERQTRDRRGVCERLVAGIDAAGRLHPGLDRQTAVALALLLTSFETFVELRRRGDLEQDEVERTLLETARTLLLAPAG